MTVNASLVLSVWIGPSLCEVKVIIKSVWFESSEFEDPKILPFQEHLPYLFLRHVPLRDIFDDYDFEVPVKLMAGLQKVLVYADRVDYFCVVPMFINALVGALRFYLPNVMLFVTFTAKAQIDGIPRLASDFMMYIVSFFPGPVGEVRC